jgi:hypothetical protein
MATATIPKPDSRSPRPVHRATRNDVLGLYATGGTPAAGTLMTAMQALAREGIRVIPVGNRHWVLRGAAPLPEIHCYSEQELHGISVSPARHVLLTTHKDNP